MLPIDVLIKWIQGSMLDKARSGEFRHGAFASSVCARRGVHGRGSTGTVMTDLAGRTIWPKK